MAGWLDLSQNITPPRAPCGANKLIREPNRPERTRKDQQHNIHGKLAPYIMFIMQQNSFSRVYQAPYMLQQAYFMLTGQYMPGILV